MPIIRVEMFPGRTGDQKSAMAKEVTDAFVRTAGGTPESVHIVITEVDQADWAVAGGIIADRSK